MTEDVTIFVLSIGLVELERRRGPASPFFVVQS